MKPILIIKTGTTLKSIPRERGDFEHWIIAGTRLPQEQFLICNVMAGEQLPPGDEVAAVVVTGSAAMVTDRLAWSEYAGAFLRQTADSGLPMLGICYGHQLLAHSLGGVVDYHSRGREIGTTRIQLTEASKDDPLFTGLPSEFSANVSHRQSIIRLPAGARTLAANAFEAYHAVRFRTAVWGVQFHPEFSEDIMQYYLAERQDVLRAEGLNVEELQATVASTPVAEELLFRFAQLVSDAS